LNYITQNEGCLASEIDVEFGCGGDFVIESHPNVVVWSYNKEAARAIQDLIAEREIVVDVCCNMTLLAGPKLLNIPIINKRSAAILRKGTLKKPHWMPAIFFTEPYARSNKLVPLIGLLKE
jgi:hypothetical protein